MWSTVGEQSTANLRTLRCRESKNLLIFNCRDALPGVRARASEPLRSWGSCTLARHPGDSAR